MRVFFSLVLSNFQRAVFTFRFLLSSFSVAILLYFTSFKLISPESDVLYILGVSILGGGGVLFIIVGVLPLFSYATSFADEWEQRATSFWIIRAGVNRYTIAKLLVVGLSVFLVTALGILIFVLFLLIKQPFFTSSSTGGAYEVLLLTERPILYLLFFTIHISLSSVLLAVISLWVSSYIPNKFVAIAAPLVIYFVIHRFTTQLDIPEYLKAVVIVEGFYNAGTPATSLLFKFGTVTILCMVLGIATVLQMHRRIKHD